MNSDLPAQRFRVAIVICYFGKMPWYFKLFVHSCTYNPGVDFILITDTPIKEVLPPNIIVINSSLQQLRERAAGKLGFAVALTSAYKLCDFRPAFGLVFEDLLVNYDFWGHGDIDVLYGNIRGILTDEILSSYDVISVRKEYVTGFFALYRNNDILRYAFRESRDFQKVFQDEAHYCFDECNFNHVLLKLGKSVFEIKAEVQCATYIVKKLQLCGAVRAYFGTVIVEELVGKLVWKEGELLYNNETPILLYHFIFFKELPFKVIPLWKELPRTFYINSFYLCSYAPGTVKGRLRHIELSIRKFFYLAATTTELYARLLIKSITTTKKLKVKQIANIQDLVGMYKDENVFIRVSLLSGCLCAQWQNMSMANNVYLFHKKEYNFLVKRINEVVNIDVEFHFDERSSAYALHVLPFKKERTILYKVKS